MTENMRHWDALKATDPRYTKPVSFGARRFTSINSQWQLQRMTEHFGPIGDGWGYTVAHSIERITPDYVLAVADVSIWHGNDMTSIYGPIRGMSPILEKGRTDDDAAKKALTDALTKGLSHIGLSADVFLGLFDDNKYVREVARQFAEVKMGDPLPDEDKHLLKDPNETRSSYEVSQLQKAIDAGWRVTNKTPKGKEDQVFAYLNLARNPDDASKISGNNAELIEASPWKDEFAEELDKLLRYFESQAAGALLQ